MHDSVKMRRFMVVTFTSSVVVFGTTFIVGSSRAQAGQRQVTHTCSVLDRQFLDTVSSNMTQLTYWSDALVANDVEPAVVVKQARAEAAPGRRDGPDRSDARADARPAAVDVHRIRQGDLCEDARRKCRRPDADGIHARERRARPARRSPAGSRGTRLRSDDAPSLSSRAQSAVWIPSRCENGSKSTSARTS